MERETYERLRALEQDHWWFAGRRAILAAEIARLGLPAKARILEAGCGAGGNLQMLAAFGEVSAIEPDGPSRQHARSRAPADVRDGWLPDGLPAFDAPFDLACAFDVLEHVEDDQGALEALRSRLAPDGRLLVTVPAYSWMWSAHDVAHHHKRRYNRPGLTKALRRSGFKVQRATYFNTALFPPIVAIRLMNRLLHRNSGGDDALPGEWINRALTRFFASEQRLLARTDLPFGVSILAVAEPAA